MEDPNGLEEAEDIQGEEIEMVDILNFHKEVEQADSVMQEDHNLDEEPHEDQDGLQDEDQAEERASHQTEVVSQRISLVDRDSLPSVGLHAAAVCKVTQEAIDGKATKDAKHA